MTWVRRSLPLDLGRGVAALASDAGRMARSGRAFPVSELAVEYGFSDLDGRVPKGRLPWSGAPG